MPLMPGSPRPGTPTPLDKDDGVYRSLFQQPVVDIPPAAPSYAWFEFLLHPEALQKHLVILRQQRKRDVHSATSAIELVREFLDQAQLVADEGNVRNKRYSALLLVAAQVALQMQLPLSAIEKALPLHFQRLLLDGIVDFAEQPSSSRSEFTKDITIQPYEAHVLHNRWTLRALVNQSQNGYLTCSSRGEGEEISSTYQMALGDLMFSHLQIAQNIQMILMNDEKQKLTAQTQVDTYYDLGTYFFSFNGYEKAYSCFSKALELMEDGENEDENMEEGGNAKLSADTRTTLEGYIAACEAVLEVQSVNESPEVLKTPKLQIEMAWEGRDWDKVIKLLENDMAASNLMRLPQGYRAVLEQQALRLLRSSSNNSMEDDPHVAAPTIRLFYNRIVMENAVATLLLDDGQEDATSLEVCVCVCIRLLQDEIFHSITRDSSNDSEATKRFAVLARFVLALCGFAFANSSGSAKSRVQQFVAQILRHFPCITEFAGVPELLRRCGDLETTEDLMQVPFADNLSSLVSVEGNLRSAVAKQREHFRLMADVGSIFAFPGTKEKDTFVAALQQEVASAANAGDNSQMNPETSALSQNLMVFYAANNCWEMVSKCKDLTPSSSLLRCQLEFVEACGALTQYLSSLATSPLSTPVNGKNTAARSDLSSLPDQVEFSITSNNKLVAEILLKWRELANTVRASVVDNSGDEKEIEERSNEVLMCLPLWIVETLVSVSAGLLLRAYMRNACDYRVSFDLTPYGELAFLEAFAPDMPSTASTDGSDTQFTTVPFVKNFQADLVGLHSKALETLVRRCGREPRWNCAKADLLLNPLSRQRLTSSSDPRAALKGYLVAASLATNFFSDTVSVVDIIDQSSLVRLSQCLVKVGAHVAAAVLYQCFMSEEFKYGLRILRLAPESHDEAFFQYFWELSFLELLVDLHSSPKYLNDRRVTLLTNLIQSPELNSSNPSPVVKDAEQRIIRCYFRDLCRIYLGD
ncbi:Integrator complex subunit 8 [Phytophthora citrophthora]|uniref:Integrator complex subunit 8 n=1 Tax=Phytophthora citrophthora TaxID=4793 RepID=A0AAD9G9Q6_9STRA|nr:Integrator complex subunit 8 [Phytophthora citrophthora]